METHRSRWDVWPNRAGCRSHVPEAVDATVSEVALRASDAARADVAVCRGGLDHFPWRGPDRHRIAPSPHNGVGQTHPDRRGPVPGPQGSAPAKLGTVDGGKARRRDPDARP